MKNKYSLRKKIHYRLDDYISKGFWAQIVLLLVVAGVLLLIFGVILMLYGEEETLSDGIWESLMHLIDQGTITGEDAESDDFLELMLTLTFIGMAFTSTIIAIISSNIQEKMHELRKGHSAVIEKDHVVIMGFNENTYTISHEIAENGMRTRIKDCVVIVDDLEKETMEHEAKGFRHEERRFQEKSQDERRRMRNSKLIFRSGDLISENTFEMCAAERARTIIINRENDLETVRILLALTSYLKKNKAYISDGYMPSVVALIHEEENLAAAKMAAGILHAKGDTEKRKNEHKVRILYYKEIFGSLFAQACIHPGLPFVLDCLFNSYAASICIEKADAEENEEQISRFAGKSFSDISGSVANCIPIGFARTDENHQVSVVLIPDENEKCGEKDKLIFLSHREELEIVKEEEQETIVSAGVFSERTVQEAEYIRHFLLIGLTDTLPELIRNMNNFSLDDSKLDVITDESIDCLSQDISSLNCNVHTCNEPYRFSRIKTILEAHPDWFDENDPNHLTNIVILSGNAENKTEADERVTVLLLNVRQYLQEKSIRISITSEMYLPKDQSLMQNGSGNDFVVASEISNRMMVQIASDPRKYYVIDELLKQRSGEIDLKPVSEYVEPGAPFNFEGVFREVRERGKANGKQEIPLGWTRISGEPGSDNMDTDNIPVLVLCPSKEEREKIIDDCIVDGFERYRMVIMTKGIFAKQSAQL